MLHIWTKRVGHSTLAKCSDWVASLSAGKRARRPAVSAHSVPPQDAGKGPSDAGSGVDALDAKMRLASCVMAEADMRDARKVALLWNPLCRHSPIGVGYTVAQNIRISSKPQPTATSSPLLQAQASDWPVRCSCTWKS